MPFAILNDTIFAPTSAWFDRYFLKMAFATMNTLHAARTVACARVIRFVATAAEISWSIVFDLMIMMLMITTSRTFDDVIILRVGLW